MEDLLFELKKPEYSYMFGFMQTDGHLQSNTRNRGRMSVELDEKDIFILQKFKELITVNSSLSTRNRDTNFKKQSISSVLTICNKSFRDTINYYGIPYGKKSNIIKPSLFEYSEFDYWRGIIDGDGSVGFTKENFPFISLVTASKELSDAFCEFVFRITGFNIKVNKNKRDEVYNITVFKEKCQLLISKLYYKNCLSLPRKYKISEKILNWIRPDSMKLREIPFEDWVKKDIDFLVSHSVEQCLLKFKNIRSENSIKLKRARERKKIINKGIEVKKFKKSIKL